VDTITIMDLGVLCRIGVPEEERSKPQRLLITVEMQGDFSRACLSDDILATANYYDVSRRIVDLCQNRTYKLIERLAYEIAEMILTEFNSENVTVEVKKFVLSDARYVSFKLSRAH
jgi:FolB domain-containing protein